PGFRLAAAGDENEPRTRIQAATERPIVPRAVVMQLAPSATHCRLVCGRGWRTRAFGHLRTSHQCQRLAEQRPPRRANVQSGPTPHKAPAAIARKLPPMFIDNRHFRSSRTARALPAHRHTGTPAHWHAVSDQRRITRASRHRTGGLRNLFRLALLEGVPEHLDPHAVLLLRLLVDAHL